MQILMMISIHLMLMLIRLKNLHSQHSCAYFNTSHVNVNLCSVSPDCCHFYISIHLMLMLIKPCCLLHKGSVCDFNTSHVNVNPMNLSLFQSRLNLSLPILSHFLKNYQPISLFLTMGLISLLPQIFTGLLEIFFINCLVNTCII